MGNGNGPGGATSDRHHEMHPDQPKCWPLLSVRNRGRRCYTRCPPSFASDRCVQDVTRTCNGADRLTATAPPPGTHPSKFDVPAATPAPAAAPAAAPMIVDFVLLPKIWPAIAPTTAPVATFCASLFFGWLRT